jgi:predicted RND superfamily exporter protein
MTKQPSLLNRFYNSIILDHPVLVVVFLLVVVSFLGYNAKNFKLDASAETLVLENDEDLRYSRIINDRYGSHDYLLVALSFKEDLLSDQALKTLARLRDELKQVQSVSSVVSILDVPLLESPPVPLKELVTNIQTLESPGVDKKLARMELQNSPLYRNLLVSSDFKTTAIIINLEDDNIYQNLLSRRNHLKEKGALKELSAFERDEYKNVLLQFDTHREKMKALRHKTIVSIRNIMKNYRNDSDMFLGGVSMIADDLIHFIKKDLKLFGTGVLFFLVITLTIIFRKIRWVVLPVLCCAFSTGSMMGLLGLFRWEVTVISSNFISLQLIITMATTIHLIVRYRELCNKKPESEHRALILDTVTLMIKPCTYAALTTIAGFGSLLFCDILPVITFGWMMSAGIVVSLVVTFLLFPSVLMLMKKETSQKVSHHRFSIATLLAGITEKHGIKIMVISCIVLIVSVIGISRLVVENSFIDYFKKSTEIYKGMKIIDQRLGGTTPLDVVVNLEHNEPAEIVTSSVKNPEDKQEFDEFDEFENTEDSNKYWFTSDKMALIMKIHDYIDGLDATGKTLSLGTMIKIAEKFNNGKPLDNFQLALLYNEMPEKFKALAIHPYVSVEDNQVRFSTRVRDSEKSLQRDVLLKKIKNDLVNTLGLKQENVRLAGMLVLYNNMLQSLFHSQITTLGIVVVALMVMFLILFRSLNIALIAISPNLLSIGVVLGIMGWLHIPLDMMTITIAAISVGIAVDDTIHYIHRFKIEFNKDRNYIKTVHRCHQSIGHAMYYTSLTIIIGFSILVLSNFIPSIYFGLLTGLAMFIALIAALTLLPQLIVFFKPLGPEHVA